MFIKKEKNEYLEVIEFLNDAIMLVNKSDKKIKFINYRFEEFFNVSKKNITNKNINFFYKKSSTILDYIDKSISKNKSYSFGSLKISSGTQSLNVNLDIINKIEYENIIIVIRSNKKDNFSISNFDNQFDFFSNFISKLIGFIVNPVSNIKSSAQLLQKIESKNFEFYEIIISEVEKLINFINLFESKQINFHKSKTNFNVHETIRSAIQNLSSIIINKINIIENFDPSLPNISSNKKELIIIFENLITNALEAISLEKGYIKISSSFYFGEIENIPNVKKNISSNFIIIEIENNGVGIKEEFSNQIFLPFFSTKNKKGLGLYQAKRKALENDIEIQFYSENNITTFKVWIPI